METTKEQSAEGLAIVRVLSAVLDRLVHANATIARSDPGQVTKFHAMKAPGIAIEQYLERIHKYASCSNECFILALIYIDRLIQRNNFLLTELNVHRVVISAVLLAAKFFDDAYYNNAYYAKVGGVLVSEMNGLEVEFLFRINFSLHVPPDVFEKYRVELLSHSMDHQHVPSIAMSPCTGAQPHEEVMPLAESNNNFVEDPATTTPMYMEMRQSSSFAAIDAASHITPSPESCVQARESDIGRFQPIVSTDETTNIFTKQEQHLGGAQSQPFPMEYNFVDQTQRQQLQPSQAYNVTTQHEFVSYRNSNNNTHNHPSLYKTFSAPPVYHSQSATLQQPRSGAQQCSLSAPPAPSAPSLLPFHTEDYVAAAVAASARQYYYPVIGGLHHLGPSDALHELGSGTVLTGSPHLLHHHNQQLQVTAHNHRGFPFSLIMDSSPSYISRRETVPTVTSRGFNESMVSITGVRT